MATTTVDKTKKKVKFEKLDDGVTPFRLEHKITTVTRYIDVNMGNLHEFFQEHITVDAHADDMWIFHLFIHEVFKSGSGFDSLIHEFRGEVKYKFHYFACSKGGTALSDNWPPPTENKVIDLSTPKGKMEARMRLAIIKTEMEDLIVKKEKHLLIGFANFIGTFKFRNGDQEELYIDNPEVEKRKGDYHPQAYAQYGGAHIYRPGAGYQYITDVKY